MSGQRCKVRIWNADFWGVEEEGVRTDTVYPSLAAADIDIKAFLADTAEAGMDYTIDDIEIVREGGTVVDKIKVIPKIREGVCELFLPDFDAKPDGIVVWAEVGQHSEASYAYYRQQKNPRGSRQEALVTAAVRVYEKSYGVRCVRVSKHLRNARI